MEKENEMDKWAVFDINKFELPNNNITPEIREYLATIARAGIKLRYPETRPYLVRIEKIELLTLYNIWTMKVQYNVLSTKIFKRK